MERLQNLENHDSREPAFDGGEFKIEFFAPPEGFNIQTRRTLVRRAELQNPFPAKLINQGNKEEVAFQQRRAERDSKEFQNPLKSPLFKPKVGLLDVAYEAGTLSFDIKPVSFVQYNYDPLGLALEENASLRDELGETSAVAMIVTTTEKDGSKKIILQHRSANNASYKDVPGASAAGLLDGVLNTLDSENPATLQPIDNDFIQKAAEKEGEEEIGIEPEHINRVKITGLAEDRNRVHYEFLLDAQLNISAQDVKEIAETKGSKERGIFDFSESFFIIDGTPEAIWTLLTEVKCPLPGTHLAAFVATGYSLKAERDGIESADIWKDDLEKAVTENYKIINGMSDGGKYNPKKSPQEQGLPDIISELQRTGLLISNVEAE